jgi:hypothetical protein
MQNNSTVTYDDIIDMSHLISDKKSAGQPLAEVEVKPKDQVRILLGEFTSSNQPRGFSVEYSPNPDPDNSMVSRVTSLESAGADSQKLILHIANYGSKGTKAKVALV